MPCGCTYCSQTGVFLKWQRGVLFDKSTQVDFTRRFEMAFLDCIFRWLDFKPSFRYDVTLDCRQRDFGFANILYLMFTYGKDQQLERMCIWSKIANLRTLRAQLLTYQVSDKGLVTYLKWKTSSQIVLTPTLRIPVRPKISPLRRTSTNSSAYSLSLLFSLLESDFLFCADGTAGWPASVPFLICVDHGSDIASTGCAGRDEDAGMRGSFVPVLLVDASPEATVDAVVEATLPLRF